MLLLPSPSFAFRIGAVKVNFKGYLAPFLRAFLSLSTRRRWGLELLVFLPWLYTLCRMDKLLIFASARVKSSSPTAS